MRRLLSLLAGLSLVCLSMVASVRPANASDDTFFDEQWPLAQIGAPDAWSRSKGAGVTIGIVDTGVDLDHPDLREKIDATADCVGGPCRQGAGRDGHGHGTMVAGVAAASTGNGRGVAGVAPDARLVVARAVDDQGRGSVEDINSAIRWVLDQGADVVNLSLGDPNFLLVSLLGTPLRPAIELAWSRGAIPVLASGNENVGLLDLGSSNYGNLNAVVVGASTRAGGPAPYSSPIGNAKWGLLAPGGSGEGPSQDILSTFPGGRYAWVAGTSMAAPHVSGALALLLAQGLGREAAIERLLSTADASVACGASCRGRLNLAGAVGSGPFVAGPTTTAAPPTTAPPIRPASPTTTAPTTSSTSTTVPPTIVVPGPTGPDGNRPEGGTAGLAGGPLSDDGGGSGDGSGARPALVATAIALVVGMAAALATTTFRRLTGVGRW